MSEPLPPDSPFPQSGGDQATARNLLFGLLAFQNGFIDREALLGAFNAWMADKSQSLGAILRERGSLDAARYELMEALVAEHLKQHGGNAEASLAALGSVDSVRHEMSLTADPAIAASLAGVGAHRAAADATVTFAPSSGSRRAGDRFRVLRFHRRGGLGQVHVARDEELGRDVALKEILPEKSHSDMLRSRFILEAEINGGLEHPGIVPVYSLGTYADGKPFYAMRFVEGDSLKEAIETYHRDHPRIDPSSLEFRKLLTRFIDVCETIAYAHSRGVLHRDLKPTNIMLGRFGEALIIDWGLAKATGQRAVGASESPEATLLPASGDSHVPTIGALGSPAYMSPEQANGDVETLGPATDIYGLGATLFHILTGRPPIQGDSSESIDAVLAKVRRGTIPAPRSLNAGIPRGLEAITMKALALKPDDRYPSAKALAEDIEHWLADEPVSAYRGPWHDRARRWSRRHRTVVTTAAAVLLLVLLGSVGVTAVVSAKNRELAKQTNRAIVREQMAIDAVKRFRDVVVEEPVLKNNPDLKDLRRKLLKEPLAFFKSFREQLHAEKATNPDALVRLAGAAHDYAHLSQEIGDIQDALRSHVDSLAIWERLVREHPAKADYEHELAALEHCRGMMLLATGSVNEALASYTKALAAWERLAAQNPTVTRFQDGVATSLGSIGLLLKDGKPAEALAAYEKSLAIRERLARDDPTVTTFQNDLASTYHNIGIVLSDVGKQGEALTAYERAMAIREPLARENPAVVQFQYDLAKDYDGVSGLLRYTGKTGEAMAALEKARDIRDRLARENPSGTEFQSGLAQSYLRIGVALMEAGKPAEALAASEKARGIWERLARDNPTVTEYGSDLAGSHTNIGAILVRDFGKPAEAMTAWEQALTIRQRLATNHPESTDHASKLGGALNDLAMLDIHTKRFQDAMNRLRQAIKWQRKALASNPANPMYRLFLANHLTNLRRAARGLGDADGVAQAQRELAELWRSDPAMVKLDARLVEIRGGKARPADTAERLQLAERAYDTAFYATAVNLWADALAAEPRLVEDRQAGHRYRYSAACAAALAAAAVGKSATSPTVVARETKNARITSNSGKQPEFKPSSPLAADDTRRATEPPLAEADRAKLRTQARTWLEAEFAAWRQSLKPADGTQCQTIIARTLKDWQSDPDLAGIRDQSALAKLPAEERQKWSSLWSKVDALLAEAQKPGE